jgi:hypothetical protein
MAFTVGCILSLITGGKDSSNKMGIEWDLKDMIMDVPKKGSSKKC